MDIRRWLSVFLALFACFFSCEAYDYYQSWAVNPSEDYNQWAGRHRFQVGDSITFKYTKGSDSVLLVNRDDYNNCNKDKPIKKMDDGSSKFMFDRSGPYYFISGQGDHCEKGQKLIVVVISQRSGGGGRGGAITPAGAPSGHAGRGAMAPGGAPSGHTGTMAPGAAPSGHRGGMAPTLAPSGGTTMGAPSPSAGVGAPGAAGPSLSGAPGAAGPSLAGGPGEANAPGPAGNETSPADNNGGKNSGWNVSPSGVWVLVVTLMVSFALSSFIGGI